MENCSILFADELRKRQPDVNRRHGGRYSMLDVATRFYKQKLGEDGSSRLELYVRLRVRRASAATAMSRGLGVVIACGVYKISPNFITLAVLEYCPGKFPPRWVIHRLDPRS